MQWKSISKTEQVIEIIERSKKIPVLIFKHSTRCSISAAALSRLERNWKEENRDQLDCFFLDLLQFRDISNQIAECFALIHQSPQALIIKNGKCVFSQSHSEIRLKDLLEA